ncbi:MAG: hypothetical protein R3217_08215 [Gammaproteobacteria bacterium]|nr:hypothetical protein [Gammaproteobacteria bacterium]
MLSGLRGGLLLLVIALAGCASSPPVDDGQGSDDFYQGGSADLAERPQNPAVIALLEEANRQQQAGNPDLASSAVERALRIAPRDPRIRLRLGWLRLEQDDPFQAKEFARLAYVHAAGNEEMQAEAWDLIAAAETRIGNQQEAELARQEAARLRD